MKRRLIALREMDSNCGEQDGGKEVDWAHPLKRMRDGGQSWSNTCDHYGDSARGIRRAGCHDPNTCRSPHGTKRRASDADDSELERICDITTKRLRTLELNRSQVQQAYCTAEAECDAGCAEGNMLPDLDYSAMNNALKVAHLKYLQERQRRGLPPLQPQDNSDMDDDDGHHRMNVIRRPVAWPSLARQ